MAMKLKHKLAYIFFTELFFPKSLGSNENMRGQIKYKTMWILKKLYTSLVLLVRTSLAKRRPSPIGRQAETFLGPKMAWVLLAEL